MTIKEATATAHNAFIKAFRPKTLSPWATDDLVYIYSVSVGRSPKNLELCGKELARICKDLKVNALTKFPKPYEVWGGAEVSVSHSEHSEMRGVEEYFLDRDEWRWTFSVLGGLKWPQ